MTWRQGHRPGECTRAAGDGAMETSGYLLPAQTLQRPAAAVTSTGRVTAAAPTCPESADLLLKTARDLKLAGKPIPSDLETAVRLLLALDQPMSAHGPQTGPAETIEITTAEMARRMGCSARHVRRLIPEGSLKARRAGRDWLITVEEEPADDPERRHTG